MSTDYPTIAHRWFEEVWNQGKEETIDELYLESGSALGLESGGGEAKSPGPAAFKQFWTMLRAAFDIHIEVLDVVTTCDGFGNTTQASRWRAQMVHKGEFAGIAATGKEAVMTGMSFAKIKSGAMEETFNNWDMHGLLEQLRTDA